MGNINVAGEMEGEMVESLRLGKKHIPVDNRGNLLVRFQGRKGGFDYISAADILNDAINEDRLKNKIVFVGTSAAGLQDTHPTPLDPHFPGVEVHATIVDNILNNQFLKIPTWSAGLEFVSVIVCGVISALILTWAGPLASIVFLALGGIFLWYGSYLLLAAKTIFINPFFTLLILVINFSFLSLLKFWSEERRLKKRTRELLLAQDTTILSMSSLAETRDNETGSHIMRTQHYMRALAKHLALQPKFRKVLDPVVIEMLYRSTPLHDIGKVGVADHILLNPGKLTSEEFEEMKKHPRYGHDTLVRAESRLKNEGGHSFLQLAREIAYYHHEKWDGTGYPQGLAGTDIPLSGRMMALADVYDALISRRRYKPAFSHEAAVDIIKRGSGTHFDPDLVDAFLDLEDIFREIAGKYSDNEEVLRSEDEFPSSSPPPA